MKDFIVGGKVTSLDLSRDETKLAVCSRDDKIQVMIIVMMVMMMMIIMMVGVGPPRRGHSTHHSGRGQVSRYSSLIGRYDLNTDL